MIPIPRSVTRLIVAALVLTAAGIAAQPAEAGPTWKMPRDFEAAILVEAETGEILFAENAYAERAPASTTKLMTALVVMDAIQAGTVSLQDSVRVSRRAENLGGTQVYLARSEVFTLEELMQALMIASANDAAVAVGEHVGGSYEGFVRLMNRRAKAMGLKATHFYNMHGLDDVPSKRNVTCAYDLAQIGRALVQYPKILEWSATRSAPFRDGRFTLYSTNRILGKIDGLDGLKTGFTWRAGFCLVATAQRREMRLIGVVLGSRTSRGRFRCAQHLLETGFMRFEKVSLCRAGEPLGIEIPVDGGTEVSIALVAGKSVSLVVPREERYRIRESTHTVDAVDAPVPRGHRLGYKQVWLGNRMLARVPAVSAHTVPRAGFFQRLWRSLGLSRGEMSSSLR
ncbi:MAG: hypothetical protein GF355_06185 [Candidatus Eisenbacteria bacterium]|nr:hypothetical protein [Candidatus Eisenbacteria bacterium]